MKIRDYKLSDKTTCLDIFKSNIPKFFLPEELSDYEDFLNQYAIGSYWVLEIENRIIACGGIGVRGNVGRLHFGIVANDQHKKGLGSQLLIFRLAKLIDQPHVNAISLDTSQHNPEFFKRFGFIETSHQENAYGPGLHRHEMVLKLPDKIEDRNAIKKKLLHTE